MTCDELKAAINSEIAQNARIAAIRSRMDAGTADFLDSELYTAITAEITAEQMRRNVLALSDREPAFVGVVRERYTDTFDTFNAVQRILDAVTGIRIRTVQPEFENDRAHKIGHSLNDPTVPESVIERRAYSATENFVRSQHDRCTQANASFRSRAGLDCRITRTGGAKCCDWCASVSGSFTTGNAPDGIWGRHDNCKCSITYETRRGSFQQLSGSGMGWDTVEELPDLPLHFLSGDQIGAGDVHAVSAGQAAGTAKKMGLHVLTNENERAKMRLNDRFYKEGDDPMFNAFGRAEDSNPKELAELQARLAELGVSFVRHDEEGAALAYQNTQLGKPGCISVTQNASYSAWLHEAKHAFDDYEAGWDSCFAAWNVEEHIRREKRAYQEEIDLARSLGREDIAKELEHNRDNEIAEIKRRDEEYAKQYEIYGESGT